MKRFDDLFLTSAERRKHRIMELRRKPIDVLTPEEIGELHDYNENFRGRTIDMAKIRLYEELKAGLIEFKENCDRVQKIEELRPDSIRQNASIYVDFDPVFSLSHEQAAMLGALMAKADRTVMAALDDSIRVSFAVLGVWQD